MGYTSPGPLSVSQDGAGMGTWRSCARRGQPPGLCGKHVPIPCMSRWPPALPCCLRPQTQQSPQWVHSACQGLIRCRSPSRAGHLFGFCPSLDTVSRLASLSSSRPLRGSARQGRGSGAAPDDDALQGSCASWEGRRGAGECGEHGPSLPQALPVSCLPTQRCPAHLHRREKMVLGAPVASATSAGTQSATLSTRCASPMTWVWSPQPGPCVTGWLCSS